MYKSCFIFFFGFGDRKRRSKEFHLTFKLGSVTQQANELLIENSLKAGSNSRFRPSLRDFTDNYNAWDFGRGKAWFWYVKVCSSSFLNRLLLSLGCRWAPVSWNGAVGITYLWAGPDGSNCNSPNRVLWRYMSLTPWIVFLNHCNACLVTAENRSVGISYSCLSLSPNIVCAFCASQTNL